MKKGVLVTLAVLLCLLCACTPAAPQETTVPTESTAPSETQVQWQPFTGKKADYVFLHSRERDRKWEEDILYMAVECFTNLQKHIRRNVAAFAEFCDRSGADPSRIL